MATQLHDKWQGCTSCGMVVTIFQDDGMNYGTINNTIITLLQHRLQCWTIQGMKLMNDGTNLSTNSNTFVQQLHNNDNVCTNHRKKEKKEEVGTTIGRERW